MKLRALKTIIAVIIPLVLMSNAVLVFAWDYDGPVIIDADEAYERSLRNDRDGVEGFWGIFMNWHPVDGAPERFRIAVVKNDFGVYEGSDYVGVNTCDMPGCIKGEIVLVLQKTADPQIFEATFLVAGGGIASGTAVLGFNRNTGFDDGLLDLSSLRYMDRLLTYGLARIADG